jgi:hypothetical protein
MGLFGLKIGWDLARDFLTEAVLTVLLPDFLYRAVTATTLSAVLFILLVICSSFTTLKREFVWLYDIFFSRRHSPLMI